MSSEKSLITTIEKKFKEGINYMGAKPNVVKEAITPPITKNNIDTVNKTDKSEAFNKKVYTSSINKSDKGKSLDKSKSTQRTET